MTRERCAGKGTQRLKPRKSISDQAQESSRWGRGRRFGGDKTTSFMGSVAEGLLIGLPATAKSDIRMRADIVFVAKMIRQRDGTGDEQRTVFPGFDGDFTH